MNNIFLHLILMICILLFSILNAIYVVFNNKTNIFFKFISIILIIFIIYISTFKEVFLPFLGSAAYPISLIPSEMRPTHTNFSIEQDFYYPNGTKIIYWAATGTKEDDVYNNPNDAYGNYNNSGVSIVNNNKAVLFLNCPNKYKVPTGNTLNKHIHYRVALPNDPILGSVKTIFIHC